MRIKLRWSGLVVSAFTSELILLVLKASAFGFLFRGTVCIRQIVCVCCWDHTQDLPHTKHIFFYWATRSALCIHIFAQMHTFLQIFFLTSLYILELSQISQYMKKSGTSAVLYPSVIKLSQAPLVLSCLWSVLTKSVTVNNNLRHVISHMWVDLQG